MKSKFVLAILLVLLFSSIPDLVADVTAVQAIGNNIERVSVSSDGTQGNSGSECIPGINNDGRYVAFNSYASNLVPNDTNGHPDIFIRDRLNNTTTLVSIAIPSDNGTCEANGKSYSPNISNDGRYIAFHSSASNLVINDTNGTIFDVFVRDLLTNTTIIISISSHGTQANEGGYVPSISGEGRYVVFNSAASNLVYGDTNGFTDIFIRDWQTSTTSRISVASDGTQANGASFYAQISADGRYVAFLSYASNLVPNDTNEHPDIFIRDLQMGTTTRISVSNNGIQGNGDSINANISAEGRYVAFQSYASNLVSNDTNGCSDIFVRDRQTSTTFRVSVASDGIQGNLESGNPRISGDGRFVVFQSVASNLVPNDTNGVWDIFVHDTQTNTTARVSISDDGTQSNDWSIYPSISADGHYICFSSHANNLVPNDDNGDWDLFVVENPLNPPPPTPPPPTPPAPEDKIYANEEYCFSLQYPGNWVEAPEFVTTPYHLAAFRVPNFVPVVIIAALDADSPMSEGWILKSFKDMSIKDPIIMSPLTDTILPNGIKAHTYKIGYITGTGYQASAFCLDADRCDKRIRIMVYTVDAFLPYDEVLFSEIAHTLTFTCTCYQPESPNASPSLPRQLNNAQISLQYLNVNPEQARINQPLTITGNVVNTGDRAGNYYLNLKINGKVEQARMVSVGPQTSQPVKFTVTKSKPGKYTIDIGGQRSSFTVIGENHSSGSASRGGVIAILAISILILTTIVVLFLNRRTA